MGAPPVFPKGYAELPFTAKKAENAPALPGNPLLFGSKTANNIAQVA
jgi:hypothetical protein